MSSQKIELSFEEINKFNTIGELKARIKEIEGHNLQKESEEILSKVARGEFR